MDNLANSAGSSMDSELRQLISCFDILYQRLMHQCYLASSSEVELSRQESRAIIVLGGRGTVIMSDLARVLNMALSTATSTIDKLVGKGLVERTRVDEDRRVVQVGLSSKGSQVYGGIQDYQFAMGRTMLEALSPGEREIFLELMTKMTEPPQKLAERDVEQALPAI